MNATPNYWMRSFSTEWSNTQPVVTPITEPMPEEGMLLMLHRVTPADALRVVDQEPTSWWDALIAVGLVVGIVGSAIQPWQWM